MITTQTRQRIEFICERIKNNASVAFEDMIFVQKWADRNPSVAQMLRRARRDGFRDKGVDPDSLDEFCQAMDIGEPDPADHLIGPQDPITLAEWFQSKRKWFRGS